jgi:CRISPR system Cascade subunit CasE
MVSPGNYEFHQEVWGFFPGYQRGDRRFIYRVEPGCIYSISEDQPLDTTGKWLVSTTTPYNPQVYKGLVLEFLVRANLTSKKGSGKHGIIMDYVHSLRQSGKSQSEWPTAEDIRLKACSAWFSRNVDRLGFSVNNFQIDQQRDVQFLNQRTQDIMKHQVLDIRGVLTVVDPEKCLYSLFKGIGSARGFGYGMVLVKAA